MNARRIVLACGLCSVTGWALVSWMTHGLPTWGANLISAITLGLFPETVSKLANGFGGELGNGQMPTTAYLTLHFILFGLALIPAIAIAKSSHTKGFGNLFKTVLVFGIAFRVVLLPSTPIHENDFYRYLWDGKSFANGVNPYLFAPADVTRRADPVGALFADPLRGGPTARSPAPAPDQNQNQDAALDTLVALRAENPLLHRRIGHPHIPTIYPPAAQSSFLVTEWLTGGSLFGWKTVVILFDLGVCILIALLLSAVGRNPAMVIVYAWSPLVLKEFANSGHLDPIPIFFTLLAILLAIRHRRVRSTCALAVGALGKLFPAALLLVLDPPDTKASTWCRYLLLVAIVAFAYLPFLVWQSAGTARVFAGLNAYNEDWQFFSGIFAVIYRTVAASTPEASLYPAKIITALMFVGIVAWVAFSSRPHDPSVRSLKRCFVVIGAFFLLSSTSFPWYYGWVVPFLCVFPNPAWIALGGLLPLSYLSFQPASEIPLGSAYWLGFPALSWLIWGGFLAALLATGWPIRSFRKPQNSSRETA